MGWYKAHSSLNGDRGSSDLIDRFWKRPRLKYRSIYEVNAAAGSTYL